MSYLSRKEKFNSFNYLVCLAQGVMGEYTTVDLRNEASVTGKLEEVDGCMNLTMTDVVFTDERGDEFCFDYFFIRERNVRCIHIPNTMSIRDTIVKGLNRLRRPAKSGPTKRTFKQKRLQMQQKETFALIEKMREERLKKEQEKD